MSGTRSQPGLPGGIWVLSRERGAVFSGTPWECCSESMGESRRGGGGGGGEGEREGEGEGFPPTSSEDEHGTCGAPATLGVWVTHTCWAGLWTAQQRCHMILLLEWRLPGGPCSGGGSVCDSEPAPLGLVSRADTAMQQRQKQEGCAYEDPGKHRGAPSSEAEVCRIKISGTGCRNELEKPLCLSCNLTP